MLPHTVCTLLTMLAVNNPPAESLVYKEVPATDPLPKSAKVQTADEAQRLVMQTLGISEITDESISTTLVKLLENRTPCIGETLLNKPVWHTVVNNSQGEVNTVRHIHKEQYARALDVYLDPVSGQVMELRTRWPDDVPAIPAELNSQEAARQMGTFGEVYHSFASVPPTISFNKALEEVARHFGNPFAAKQIIGRYVMWSQKHSRHSEVRPVWAITLRGVEPPRRHGPGERKYNRRFIIDAMTGKHLRNKNYPKNKKVGADGNLDIQRLKRSKWFIQTKEQLSTCVVQVFGLPEAFDGITSPKLVVLADDNTPSLAEQIEGRKLWTCEVRLSLELLAPAEIDASSERVFDVLVDPTNGCLLKIVSRWPPGVPKIAPMPSAAVAEKSLRKNGHERYLGFPTAPPEVSFLEALRVVRRNGVGDPLIAKQIHAQYVTRTKMGKEPEDVWAITLRGISALPFERPNVPEDARNHMRNIVDASTGKWISASTSPQPEGKRVDAPVRVRRGPVPAP